MFGHELVDRHTCPSCHVTSEWTRDRHFLFHVFAQEMIDFPTEDGLETLLRDLPNTRRPEMDHRSCVHRGVSDCTETVVHTEVG